MNAVIQTFGADQSSLAVVAAFIQAALSGVAIFAAVMISVCDRQERERSETKRIVSALAAMCSRGDDALRRSYLILKDQGFDSYQAHFDAMQRRERDLTIAQCLRVVVETPALSLGDWDLVSALFDMEKALRDAQDVFARLDIPSPASVAYPSVAYVVDLADLKRAVNLSADAKARVRQTDRRLSGKRACWLRIDRRGGT